MTHIEQKVEDAEVWQETVALTEHLVIRFCWVMGDE